MLAQSAPLSAEDRVAIVDTLYRFAGGQDDRDPALLESAFAQDAVLDFTSLPRRWASTLHPLRAGRKLSTSS